MQSTLFNPNFSHPIGYYNPLLGLQPRFNFITERMCRSVDSAVPIRQVEMKVIEQSS